MEFRILGPLEVSDEGREVSLGGPKPRALLAVLLLHANEVVPTDRLIDELWGEDSPGVGAAHSAPHQCCATGAGQPLRDSRPSAATRPPAQEECGMSARRSRRREGAGGETSCDSTLALARGSGMSGAFEKGGQRRVEVNDLSNRARSAAVVTRTRAPSAARTVRPLSEPSRSMTVSRLLA
jgi:hypothetical protein